MVEAFPNLPARQFVIAMAEIPGENAWYASERGGVVWQFENDPDVNSYDAALDLSGRVATNFELGLTGIAVHPDYPSDNRVFIVYNDNLNGGRSTVSSFTIDTNTRAIDSGSEQVLLTLSQPRDNHNGGDIAFGLDGMLYLSFGDGGDDRRESQDLTNIYGTILRLDVSTTPYSIPVDNPFNLGQSRCDSLDQSRTSNCPEIFAYGFRNPWRFSVDIETGEIWVADVGESDAEEVNRIESGANYGWPIMEGANCLQGSSCDTTGLSLPITEYDLDGQQAIIGAYVYRGEQSALNGKYFFGDVSGQFYTVDANATPGVSPTPAFNTGGRSIFGAAQDSAGEIYLVNYQSYANGTTFFALTSTGSTTVEMPKLLSETGCFNTDTKTSATGVFDYDINTPLWSDGASKERAFAIPDDELVEVLIDGDFRFPTDSVLMKHFLNGETYLETRLLINHSNGWLGYSYEWNDAQTDATLLDEGKTKDVGEFVHTFPSQSDCGACHTAAANTSLGIELAQLNQFDPDRGANIIDYLSDAGYLSSMHDGETSPTLYAIDDAEATLEQRARSYLHSNCSGCHRPGATGGFMDLTFAVPFADTNTCDVDATTSDLGISGAKRIAPGNPDASVVLRRMESNEDGVRMPPIATSVEDEVATALIRNWIASLSDCGE